MSKAVQDKVNELFEATKNLKSFEEMQPYCAITSIAGLKKAPHTARSH